MGRREGTAGMDKFTPNDAWGGGGGNGRYVQWNGEYGRQCSKHLQFITIIGYLGVSR